MGKLRDRFTFANVVSVLSLLFALGLGTAWAAKGLPKNQVRSWDIAKGQVKTPDLGKGAVTSFKVKNGALLSQDFAQGVLPTSGIQKVVAFSANEDVNEQDVTVNCPPGKKAVGGGGGWGLVDAYCPVRHRPRVERAHERARQVADQQGEASSWRRFVGAARRSGVYEREFLSEAAWAAATSRSPVRKAAPFSLKTTELSTGRSPRRCRCPRRGTPSWLVSRAVVRLLQHRVRRGSTTGRGATPSGGARGRRTDGPFARTAK